MRRLENKVAVVTGGASGIGKAAVLKFAEEGARVVVVDVNESGGKPVVAEIESNGGNGIFLRVDVSKDSEVKGAIEHVEKEYGALSVLYNNASVYLAEEDGCVTDIAEDTWDKVLSINLKSVYLFCKYSIPVMIRSGGGSIINTGSSAAMIGIPNNDAYTATKGATVAMTRSMAVEFGPKNIRVNCISPAAIQTPMMNKSNPEDSDFDEKRFLGLRSPLRRYGSPEEIAKLAVFLASDDSAYINGAIITADGGITINGDLSKLPDECL